MTLFSNFLFLIQMGSQNAIFWYADISRESIESLEDNHRSLNPSFVLQFQSFVQSFFFLQYYKKDQGNELISYKTEKKIRASIDWSCSFVEEMLFYQKFLFNFFHDYLNQIISRIWQLSPDGGTITHRMKIIWRFNWRVSTLIET